MSRLDDAIDDLEYILSTLKAYREMTQQNCCNTCGKSMTCKYRPGWGKPVRINCHLWTRVELTQVQEDS